MPDPKLVALLYARRTLEEMTADWRNRTDLPVDSGLGKLMQAQLLLEQGKSVEAQDLLMDALEHAEETRIMLWASKALRDLGLWPGGLIARQAQGVVFEVPMQGSTDVLAVYRDNRVRFFSYSGAMAFYEPSANVQAMRQLCQQIISVADQISETPRTTPPSYRPGDPRVTILTISGEMPVGAEAGGETLLALGAQVIGSLVKLQRQQEQS